MMPQIAGRGRYGNDATCGPMRNRTRQPAQALSSRSPAEVHPSISRRSISTVAMSPRSACDSTDRWTSRAVSASNEPWIRMTTVPDVSRSSSVAGSQFDREPLDSGFQLTTATPDVGRSRDVARCVVDNVGRHGRR
jgi:hypothetical protein